MDDFKNKKEVSSSDLHLELKRLSSIFHNFCEKNGIPYFLGYGSLLGAVREKGIIEWDSDVDIIVPIEFYSLIPKLFEESDFENAFIHSFYNKKDHDSLLMRLSNNNVCHKQVHIDLFPMFSLPKNKIMGKLFRLYTFILFTMHRIKNKNIKDYSLKKKIIFSFVKAFTFFTPNKFYHRKFIKHGNRFPTDKGTDLFNYCGSYGVKEIVSLNWFESKIELDFEGLRLIGPKHYHEYLSHFYGDYMTPKKTNYI